MSIDGTLVSEFRVVWLTAWTSPLIAVFGIWIAFQQYRLKKYTLRKDLFDKRLTVFYAAIELINMSLQSQHPKIEAVDEFNQKVAAAPFLFNTEITDYLKELRRRYLKIREISDQENDQDFSDDNVRDRLLKERREHKQWMREQPTIMETLFKKYFNLIDA